MRPATIEDILMGMRVGGWFGFGGKEKIYANLIIHTSDEKPTQAWLETELASQQAAWDAAVADEATNKASAKSKLVDLGLSEDEISAAFGI
jgi:hypothetical protein|tara:strand:+ start:450 stop:722 length:273 start_codon:yes stop_codon:yes gene_type:complete